MTTDADTLVDNYLRRLAEELRSIPSSRRQELLDEVTEHINEARSQGRATSEIDVRQLLERLGPPEDIAAAAMGEEPTGEHGSHTRRVWGLTAVAAGCIGIALGIAALVGAFNSNPPAPASHLLTPTTVSQIAVPNVLGLSLAQAGADLSSADLAYTNSLSHSTSQAAGTVIAQMPYAGSRVPPMSQVHLVVSSGP